MAIDFQKKDQYTMEDLLAIMNILRSPEGCPWDREQTHESIRKNFLEETYEAVEAIDSKDPVLLREELGDVLLQVVFHARMEEEQGSFTFDDVCDGVCKKLVLRHPHIFGDVEASTSQEVLKNWDAIKKEEKKQETFTDSLNSVPRVLPALMRSSKVQHRAARAGFDFADAYQALECVPRETQELREAMQGKNEQEIEKELGDLLFSVVNVARLNGLDAEECLTRASDKFIRRFSKVEELAKEKDLPMPGTSMEELDQLWQEVKVNDR